MKKKAAKKSKPAKKAKKKAASKPKARVKARKTVAKKKSKTPLKRAESKASAASTPKPGVIAPTNSILLGYVEDYFAKVGVIALTLKAGVAVGQQIQVLGHTTHIEQPVGSMQIDHVVVNRAGSGDGVGIKVKDRARQGDHVYLMK